MAQNFLKIFRGISISPQLTSPTSAVDGDVYYNASLGTFQFHQGGSFVTLGTGSLTGPGTTTNNAIATWSGTTGASLLNTLVTIDTSGQMSIQSGQIGLVIGADANTTTRTNSTTKQAAIGSYHYTNASAPMGMMIAQSSAAANDLYIGGGSSIFNAASSIRFYTGAGNSTLTGAQAGFINAIGSWGIASSSIDSRTMLDIGNGTALITGNTIIGTRIIPTGLATTTSNVTALFVRAASAASAITLGLAISAEIGTVTKGAGSTITSAIGLLLDSQTNGTNNAVLTDNISFAGSWFINSTNTNPSLLSGQTMIGTNPVFQTFSTRTGNFQVSTNGGANRVSAFIHEGSSSGPLLTVGVNPGTPGTYTFPTSGSILGNLAFAGANNATSSYGYGGFIFMSAASTWTSTNAETKYEVDLAPSGSLSSVAVHTISSAGLHTLGGTGATVTHLANGSLQINRQLGVFSGPNATDIMYVGSTPSAGGNTILSGTTQEAARIEITSNTSATARTIALTLLANTAAAAYSTTAIALRVQTGTIGAGSTVGTNIGIAFQAQVAGGTNNACISDNEAFSGNYFINSTSTAATLFSGAHTINNTLSVSGNASHFGLVINSSNVMTVSNSTDLGSHTINGNLLLNNSTNAPTVFEVDNLGGSANTAAAAAISLVNGDASTSNKQCYIQFRNRDSSNTNWYAGTAGDNNFSIVGGGSVSLTGGSKFMVITTAGATYFSGPSLRTGASSSAVVSATEQFTSDLQLTAATNSDSNAGTFLNVVTGNTAITAGQLFGSVSRLRRVTSANTTDGIATTWGAHVAIAEINPSTATTYTNTNTQGIASSLVYLPANIGAGTAAVNLVSGIYLRNSGSTTGARALGIYSDGVSSGSTGNAVLADNILFTGNYFINSSSTNPSVLSGTLNLPDTAISFNSNSGLTLSRQNTNQFYLSAAASTGSAVALVARNTTGAGGTGAQLGALTASGGSDAYVFTGIIGATNFWQFGIQASTSNFILSYDPSGLGSGTKGFTITTAGVMTTSGQFGNNGAAGASAMMKLNGNTLTGASQFAVEASVFTATSAATTAVASFVSGATTANAAFTTAARYQFFADNITKGAASTITRDIGYFLNGGPSQGTNNASISDNTTFTGNYFINSVSTNSSVLGGNLALGGGGSASAMLDIRAGGVSGAITSFKGIQTGNFVIPSTVTSAFVSYASGASTAATSFTLPLYISFNSSDVTVGSGSTVTRSVGLFLNSLSSGSTGNAQIADNNTFTGNYFINSTSANQSLFSGLVNLAGGVAFATTRTVTTTATVGANDTVILTNQSAAFTLTLPTATDGRVLVIKDVSGSASANNVTISRAASDLIDGLTSFVMSTNYSSITLIGSSGKWSIV